MDGSYLEINLFPQKRVDNSHKITRYSQFFWKKAHWIGSSTLNYWIVTTLVDTDTTTEKVSHFICKSESFVNDTQYAYTWYSRVPAAAPPFPCMFPPTFWSGVWIRTCFYRRRWTQTAPRPWGRVTHTHTHTHKKENRRFSSRSVLIFLRRFRDFCLGKIQAFVPILP